MFQSRTHNCNELRLEDAGREVAHGADDISQYIAGLTPSNFRNSIGVGQMETAPDTHFGEDMQTYMANLSMGANEAVDVSRAMAYLRAERKRITAALPDEQIRENEEKIRKIAVQMEDIPELIKNQQALSDQAQALKKEEEALNAGADEELRADQASRFEAARLIQQNNDITARYREKKAQLQAIEREGAQEAQAKIDKVIEACEKRRQQMEETQVRIGELQSELQSSPLKHLVIVLPLLAVAVSIWLAGNILGLDSRQRILGAVFVGLAAVCMLLLMGAFSSRKRKRLAGLQADLQTLGAAQEKVFSYYNVSSIAGLRQAASVSGQKQIEVHRIRQELAQLKQQYDALQEPLRPYIEKYGEVITTDSLAGEVTRSQAGVLRKQRETLEKQIEQIEWQLEHLIGQQAEKTSLEEMNESLELTRKRLNDELAALDLCARTLRDITQHIHGTFGAEMNTYVSALLDAMTGGMHKRLVIDENFRVLVDDGRDLLLPAQLSGGTADQVWFATRMAVSQLFFEEKMPLILDDSFVSYDDERLENTLKWLAGQEVFSQVILMSCQHREAQILEKAGIPFNLCKL